MSGMGMQPEKPHNAHLSHPGVSPELRAINPALPGLSSTTDCASVLFPTETSPKCTLGCHHT